MSPAYKFTAPGTFVNPRTVYKSMLVGNERFFGGSYESIATITVGSGGSSSVDFQNIPATYQHLQIRIMALPDGGGGNLGIRFNNDSGSNYSGHQFQGNGSAAEANAATSQTSASRTGLYTDSSIYAAVTVIDILDYANTNKHKTIRALTGQDGNATGTATDWRVGLHSGRWGDSTAISRITTTGVTFREKTTFALYGIRSA